MNLQDQMQMIPESMASSLIRDFVKAKYHSQPIFFRLAYEDGSFDSNSFQIAVNFTGCNYAVTDGSLDPRFYDVGSLREAVEAWIKATEESNRKEQLARFFHSYSSIGGYPQFVVWQGEAYCTDCVNENTKADIDSENHENDCEWLDNQELSPAINWEDPSLYCTQCSERIESAYADEDSSEDELYCRDLSKDWQNHI